MGLIVLGETWKLKVAQKVKIMVWVIFHGKLMANMERQRRGMTQNPHCHYCSGEVEDLNNVLKNYTKVRSIWTTLVDESQLT